MNNMTKVALFVTASLGASSALAADWSVTQLATVTVAAPTQTQGATTNVVTSNQALNGIDLNIADDLLQGSQTANIAASGGLVLTQGSKVDGSTQAINYAKGHTFGSTAVFTQKVAQLTAGTTQLIQKDDSSTGTNVQAANLTVAAGTAGNVITVTQDYDEAGALSLVQSAVTTPGNTQGVNYTSATGDIGGTGALTQDVNVIGVTTFAQGAGNTGGANIQVANGALSTRTNGVVSNVNQDFTGGGSVTLTQETATAGANTQALNRIATTGATSNIGAMNTQDVSITGTTKFDQDSAVGSPNNIQAGNLGVSAFTVTGLTQKFAATTLVDFEQSTAAASNIQAGNAMTVVDTASGAVQNFEITSSVGIDFLQSASGTKNIQAGNLATSAADITTLGQTFSQLGATEVDFDQTATGINNVQAGNLTTAVGNISATAGGVDQAFVAGVASIVDFDQTPSADSNTQAGNMVSVSGAASVISGVLQTFTGSTTANEFTQAAAQQSLIQAANLIDLGTGGSVSDGATDTQVFTTTGTVAMSQSLGTNNLQALNGIAYVSTAAASTVKQNLTINTGTFTMVQDDITTSGQYGNFVGEK